MPRRAVTVFMLFALLWQSVALARVGSSVNVLADMAHAALHWQAMSHHHHADGSYHLDDSAEAAQHVVSDHVSATVALLVVASHQFPPLASDAPGGLQRTPAPQPIVDGLLRPPRPHA